MTCNPPRQPYVLWKNDMPKIEDRLAELGYSLPPPPPPAGNYLPATRNWSHRLELKAVCDVDQTRARHFANEYGAEGVFTDYEDMLRNADIDAVAVFLITNVESARTRVGYPELFSYQFGGCNGQAPLLAYQIGTE